MTRRVADIAAELGITEDQVRTIIGGLGLRVGKTASKVNDDVARMAVARAKGLPVENISATPAGRRGPARGKGRGAVVESPEDFVEEDDSPVAKKVELAASMTVKELAERLHLKSTAIIGTLLQNGIFATINDSIDYDTAAVVATDLEFEPVQEAEEEAGLTNTTQLRELLAAEVEENLVVRPPVVSVIGHVDHGKTSLLDAIRGTSVQTGEAGGITQKIGAYQIEHAGKKITFLDTPGHEAFSAMRARGVKSTDIAILVVAADDGVKPQTIEALAHARQAKVPVVVAISKIDKADANPMRVKQQLTEHEILVEEFGGQTVVAEVSAKSGKGITELLDMILLVAEVENLRANPDRSAVASVIESHLDPNMGPVATVLVHSGTLKMRDHIVVGGGHGRVKTMHDYTGARIEIAPPSTPVRLAGLSTVPRSGDVLQVMDSEQEARAAAERAEESVKKESRRNDVVFSESAESDGKKREYLIVLKGDLRGSIEAIKSSLERLVSDVVQLKLIHLALGDVTDSDVLLASASKADIYAFNVRVPVAMIRRADIEGIQLRSFNVIYKLVEEVEGHLNAMLEPERVETPLGKMKVLKIFYKGKDELVVGGDVTQGVVQPKSHVRVFRGENMIGEGEISEVKQGPETVQEMKQGTQCGVRIQGGLRVMEGDTLEISKVELRQRTVTKVAAQTESAA